MLYVTQQSEMMRKNFYFSVHIYIYEKNVALICKDSFLCVIFDETYSDMNNMYDV